MKINKACDLSSISVLPPQSRRSSGVNGAETSIFSRSQGASQIRSQQQQQSQQSFSQGVSSQHGGAFSQLTQNSPDDLGINDQRFGSQGRENSTKGISLLPPPINKAREESQMQLSRSSSSLMRKWNSGAPEHRSHISEDLEYRIGMMETSLSRFGIILDSVQSDIMQVNKGRKEAALEMESIRQKLNVNDTTLQLLNKGQEDFKFILDKTMKSMNEQLSQNSYRESLKEIFSLLSDLPQKIEVYMKTLQNDVCRSFIKEMQEMVCSLQTPNQKRTPSEMQEKICSLRIPDQKRTPTVPPPKVFKNHTTSQANQSINRLARDLSSATTEAVHPKVQQSTMAPKIEMGTWNSVKRGHTAFTRKDSNKGQTQKRTSTAELERHSKVNITSDEEMDGDFCCLLEDKGTGNFSIQEAREETQRILRKARRRKRKYNNTIIIN